MKHNTAIQLTYIPGFKGETWNPVVGCSLVSKGCTNCYAMKMAARLERMGTAKYQGLTTTSKGGPVWTGEVRLDEPDAITAPLRWRKPRAVFVNSMGDLFHGNVPDAWIDQVFAVMALCPQHRFIILTKRAKRMRDYVNAIANGKDRFTLWASNGVQGLRAAGEAEVFKGKCPPRFPLPNVWLGVSAEDQETADFRIPLLLETRAAVRLVSCEPLLGAVDLTHLLSGDRKRKLNALTGESLTLHPDDCSSDQGAALDWVIAGGESDTDGQSARAMHPDWVRSLRDQCAAAGTPFFFKQWGAHQLSEMDADGVFHPPLDARAFGPSLKHWTGDRFEIPAKDAVVQDVFRPGAVIAGRVGKHAAGRTLDGVTHDGFPASVCAKPAEARDE